MNPLFSSSFTKPKRNPNHSSSLLSSSSPCNRSLSAPIDLILLVLVLFSCAFLVSSSLSHIVRSLSSLLPPSPLPLPRLLLLILIASSLFLLFFPSLLCPRPRRCSNPECRGVKKAFYFDVRLQTEDCIRERGKDWKEIEDLPSKGSQQGRNAHYDVLRAELRRLAPVNGRAVLLFRSRCGCPVAKLEAWGPKRVRHRHKRSMVNLVTEGGK